MALDNADLHFHFVQANGFHEAAVMLSANPQVTPTTIALYAFAIELYLKFLLLSVNGNYQQKHNLKELFGSLPQEMRDEIESGYAKEEQTIIHAATGANFARMSHEELRTAFNKIIKPRSFAERLEESSEAFVRFRYLHEMKEITRFSLKGLLPVLLREAEKRVDTSKIAHVYRPA